MPKHTSLNRETIDPDLVAIWIKLCDFSQLRHEAFGDRVNQTKCENRGEAVNRSDPRYLSPASWHCAIFVHDLVSEQTKRQKDWLPKAKMALGVLIDMLVDSGLTPEDLHSERRIRETIENVEAVIKRKDFLEYWEESLLIQERLKRG